MGKQPWVSIDAGVVPPEKRPRTWAEAKESPCTSCRTAPCCTYLPLHTFRVSSMLELDHAGYLLNFERIELGLTAAGDWGVYYRLPCRHLDRENFLCALHDTPRQPHICRNYNPYSCWYRKVLRSTTTDAYLRVDRPRLDFIIAHCVFDDDRNILEVPTWETMREAFQELASDEQSDDDDNVGADPVFARWLREIADAGPEHAEATTVTFDELNDPCAGCSATCCKTLVFPHGTPTSASNLDYLRFCLGFPGIELAIADVGWSLVVKTTCRHLDAGNRCSVYGQPERPLICRYYDAHSCSYRWQFGQPRPQGFLRVRYEQFDAVLGTMKFDEHGFLTEMPTTDKLRTIVERAIQGGQINGES